MARVFPELEHLAQALVVDFGLRVFFPDEVVHHEKGDYEEVGLAEGVLGRESLVDELHGAAEVVDGSWGETRISREEAIQGGE